MTLGRLHSLTLDDSNECIADSAPTTATSVAVASELLEELDDFLQWVKDPTDASAKHLGDVTFAGDTESPLGGASKNTLRTAELLEEITLLRDMDIVGDSFFGRPTTATTLDSSRPHLRNTEQSESNASSAAVTPISESGDAPPQAPAKKKRDQNRSRKRQREELLQLRVVAKELETQLKQLLYPDDDGTSGSSSGECATSSPSGSDELASSSLVMSQRHSFLHKALFWKRAAAAAKQRVDFAQMENARLRALIEENELVCDGARDIWHKHPATKLTYSDAFDSTALHNTPIRDFAPFEALHAGLGAVFQQQRTVWEECGLDNNLVMERKPECRLRTDGGDAFIEMTRSTVLPFSPDEVNQCLWRIVNTGLLTSSMGELKMRKAVENTYYLTLSDSIRLSDDQDLTVKAWIVAKQIVEGDQIVAAWRSIAEIQSGVVPTFELSESGWSIVRSLPVAGRPISLKQAPSVLQMCARSTPERSGVPLSRDEFSADSGVARAISQFHQNRVSLIQVVENTLLDESLIGRSKSRVKPKEGAAFSVSL